LIAELEALRATQKRLFLQTVLAVGECRGPGTEFFGIADLNLIFTRLG
jgi:hypothetical protein